MKEIREASKVVPVMAETDVLVVVSGPGGLAAAREGLDTMLVERYGSFRQAKCYLQAGGYKKGTNGP